MQTFATAFSPAFTGRYRSPREAAATMPLDARKVIARRAAFELPVNGVVNLGIGMPEGVAGVAGEERLLDHITLTAEPGVIGGQPASGLDFGAAVNTDAIIDQNQQFDFYDGGGLDMAFLSFAQVDRHGNVNVSRYGPNITGPGGFINISQGTRKVTFSGTLTTGGLDIHPRAGAMDLRVEGKVRKFVPDVEQITFSGQIARERGQEITYITDRAVFRLMPEGLVMTEIAPGIDLRTQVLDQIGFDVHVAPDLEPMDPRLFNEGPMGWLDDFEQRQRPA